MPISFLEQAKLASKWFPLLAYGQKYLAATDTQGRVLVAGEIGQWLAGKTATKFDDLIVGDIVEILKTEAGQKLVSDLASLGNVVAAAEGAS